MAEQSAPASINEAAAGSPPIPGAETSLAVAAPAGPSDLDQRWESVLWLPCRLAVDLPVHGVTIGDLLGLAVGSVIASRWPEAADLPVQINGQVVGWSEFEVAEERLAVRFTELA